MASGLMTPIKTPNQALLGCPSRASSVPSIVPEANVIGDSSHKESSSKNQKPKPKPKTIDLKQLGSGKCCNKDERYPTSYFRQLSILLLRTFLILWRDRSLTTMRIAIHLMMAPLIGVLYFGIGNEAHNALNNYKYAFFSIMFLMYTAFSSIIMNCEWEGEGEGEGRERS